MTHRRLEPLHGVFGVLFVVGCGLVALLHPVVAAVVAFDGLAVLYLVGPAAAIRVTPTSVVVDNPYLRYDVPRSAIAGPVTDGFWFPHLPLTGGRRVRLVAYSLNLPRGYPDRISRHHEHGLGRMLGAVPQQADDGVLRRSPRWLNVGVVVLAVAVPVVVAAAPA